MRPVGQRDRTHRIPARVTSLASPAAGGAYVNEQQLPPAPKPSNKPRRLMVGYASTATPGISVPYLRLRGRWLHDAGFVIGRHVKIEVDAARLMIEPVD